MARIKSPTATGSRPAGTPLFRVSRMAKIPTIRTAVPSTFEWTDAKDSGQLADMIPSALSHPDSTGHHPMSSDFVQYRQLGWGVVQRQT